jgi:hypothetical protein
MGPDGGCGHESLVMPVPDADGQDPPGSLEPEAPRPTMSEFASHIANRLFLVGLSLDRAHGIVGNGPAGDRLAAATDEVNQLISDVRATVVNSAADPLAALRKRMAHTARELQARALEAAARLERQAYIARQPSRLDYRAEIKRWLAFADQADKMARQWEQPP